MSTAGQTNSQEATMSVFCTLFSLSNIIAILDRADILWNSDTTRIRFHNGRNSVVVDFNDIDGAVLNIFGGGTVIRSYVFNAGDEDYLIGMINSMIEDPMDYRFN